MHVSPRAALLARLLSILSIVRAIDSVSTDINAYGTDGDTPFQTYVSNPDVKPPELLITKAEQGLADGYLFIGVDGKPASTQNVPCIFDLSLGPRMGSLVWTSADYSEPFDFKTQTYKGQPVLTFFTGELLNGYGHGSYYILNQSYAPVTHFSPVGYEELGDLHEFTITKDDTALVTIYVAQQADLTLLGGPSDGWIFDGKFQELDPETNELIFSWSAIDHVAINETYNDLSGTGTSEEMPFDYFHINSVEKDANGDYLVSGRVMDAVFKISGQDGSIIWRLNGKLSDFDVSDDAKFAFQHDAQWVDDAAQTRMTIFDNGPEASISYSRGLLFDVDQSAKTVKPLTEFKNGPETFAQFEGSLQMINPSNSQSNFFLGFGSQQFFSELSSNGTLLLDGQFGKTNAVNSYRAFKLPWVGKPTTKPDIHYDNAASAIYLSWNGATEIENWMIYTADTANSSDWSNVTGPVSRTGFETSIDLTGVDGLQNLLRGKAMAANGAKLGWTSAVDGGGATFDAPDLADNATVLRTANSTQSSSPSSSSIGVTSTATMTGAASASPTKKSLAAGALTAENVSWASLLSVLIGAFVLY